MRRASRHALLYKQKRRAAAGRSQHNGRMAISETTTAPDVLDFERMHAHHKKKCGCEQDPADCDHRLQQTTTRKFPSTRLSSKQMPNPLTGGTQEDALPHALPRTTLYAIRNPLRKSSLARSRESGKNEKHCNTACRRPPFCCSWCIKFVHVDRSTTLP